MEPRFFSNDPDWTPQRRPFAWVTWTIVGTTVAVFLLQLLELHKYGEDVVGNALAFSPQALAEHRYWTVLTYAWVHAVAMFGDSGFFWLHIVANMIPLVCLGVPLEEIIGPWRFLRLYLGGAGVSALVWYIFSARNHDDAIIGASGAVFAVIAAIAVAEPRAPVTVLLLGIIPLFMRMGIIALVICGIEVLQVVAAHIPFLAAYSMSEIAHSAHLGGAAFGAIYMWRILRRARRRGLPR